MSEVKFIKGFGKSECQVFQEQDVHIVEGRYFETRKEFPIDKLLHAIVYAQENFAVVNFPTPLVFKETDTESSDDNS